MYMGYEVIYKGLIQTHFNDSSLWLNIYRGYDQAGKNRVDEESRIHGNEINAYEDTHAYQPIVG